ncbi:aminotransferase class V-fold PLP-dependent enzyme [Oscillibacter sp.]|uniref:aminotransferase class V-fold PLP-dependent enzyme n=1 Tax=Oscillibacter sp. TaxID=1945593 RepID=UPI00257C256D|nr:aminotransferase class V-fold PLP-dependent enzyme [Oscillibacter sp.]
MEHYLIIARSVTYAQRMQRALARSGIRSRIFRAPRDLTDRGCAYAVQIADSDLTAALTALHRESLDPVQIFLTQPGDVPGGETVIYFDSAATTFQKPRTVADAMRNAMATMSSPGRGGYPAAMRAAEAAFDCRTELADLYHLENPEQVAFTMNATHSLNIAIKSLVPPGGKAVISGYEHNAVTRPLAALGAQVSVAAAPLFQPAAVTAAFDRLIVPGTDAVICNHVSNVFGFVQPVEAIAAICREREVPFIIDASQSAGLLTLT